MSPEQDKFMDIYEKLNEKLLIDKFNLDKEVEEQPTRHQDAGQQWALALSMRDAAENHVKVMEAKLYGKYRQEALDNGEKITEDRLKFKVACSQELIVAQDNLISWKYLSGLFWKLCESFEQRTKMLDNLGRLHNSGWFEKPSIGPMPDRNTVVEQVKQAQNQHRTERAQRFNRS